MSTRTVSGPPATLPLLVKAALPAIPLVGGLPGIRHTGRETPGLVLRREGVTTDPGHLARYRQICGFDDSPAVPATYPHMPAFALHLMLMTDSSFPLLPMGLVHLRNSITQERALGVDDAYDLEVRAEALRPHPKGRLIDIVSEASVDGVVVWHEITTLFARGRGGADEDSAPPLADLEAPTGTTEWTLPGDLGRRYAAVSGDRNPIHLHPLTAKAFGFGSAIAHGMWTLARSVAEIEADLPPAFRLDTEFRRPVLLPATVRFGRAAHGPSIDLGVTSADGAQTHLVGRVTPTD